MFSHLRRSYTKISDIYLGDFYDLFLWMDSLFNYLHNGRIESSRQQVEDWLEEGAFITLINVEIRDQHYDTKLIKVKDGEIFIGVFSYFKRKIT